MNLDIVVRIGTPNPARFWTGAAYLYLPADDIETEHNALYLGGGSLLSSLTEIEIEQLRNGEAGRLELGVTGANAEIARNAKAEFVSGSFVDIGVVQFDPLWQMLGITWEARYRADKLNIARDGSGRTITLSMGTDDTGRSRSPNSYWTNADQRRRSPDDAIFDHVAGINAGTSRPFGTR